MMVSLKQLRPQLDDPVFCEANQLHPLDAPLWKPLTRAFLFEIA
jgi:hypothetical protein